MVKKRIQEIWHAGLEDFAARRQKAQAGRLSPAAPPSRRSTALEREADEQVRRAVLAATGPLRQELDVLKEEVGRLRALVEEAAPRGKKGGAQQH